MNRLSLSNSKFIIQLQISKQCGIGTGVDTKISNKNIKENAEIDPHKYIQLIFDRAAKAVQFNKIAFSISGTGAIGQPQEKNKKKGSTPVSHIIQKVIQNGLWTHMQP